MTDGAKYLDEIKKQLEAGRRVWRRGDKILAAFGYVRRRQSFVDQVNDGLQKRGLRANPAITTALDLESYTSFSLAPAATSATEPAVVPPPAPEPPTPAEVVEEEASERTTPPMVDAGNPADLSLTVRNLECAERMPLTVKPDTTIIEALTQMQLKDYSQLVVSTGERSVKGIVSYRSIANAQLHGQPTRVGDCIDENVPRAGLSAPLLDVIAQFQRHDCVLVFGDDKKLCGVVTPADIAIEFRNMAGPFLVIGEIEEHLRWLVERSLDVSTVSVGAPGAVAGVATKASDLTMGDVQRILEDPANWAKVGVKFDRAMFCAELEDIRHFRNALMHFREPIGPDDLQRIRNFADMLRTACAALARGG